MPSHAPSAISRRSPLILREAHDDHRAGCQKIGRTRWDPNLIHFTNTRAAPAVRYQVQNFVGLKHTATNWLPTRQFNFKLKKFPENVIMHKANHLSDDVVFVAGPARTIRSSNIPPAIEPGLARKLIVTFPSARAASGTG